MPMFKTGYLEGFEEVKAGLLGVVETYLKENFADLADTKNRDMPWKSEYSTSFSRFFSFRGEEGYKRALALLETIKGSENSADAIKKAISCSCSCDRELPSNKLYTMVLEHLYEHMILTAKDDKEFSKLSGIQDVTAMQAAINRVTKNLINECLASYVPMTSVATKAQSDQMVIGYQAN